MRCLRGLFCPLRRLATVNRLFALTSVLGLMGLAFLLGAAVMFFRLRTSTYLEKAFAGIQVWSREQPEPAASSPAVVAAGVLIDKPDRTNDGFTLYTTNAGTRATLIDMRGHTVHRWQMPFSQAFPDRPADEGPASEKQVSWFGCYLYPSGDLLAVYHVDAQVPLGAMPAPGSRPLDSQALNGYGLVKIDKDSRLLWAYSGRVHHALDVGEDGAIYALTQEMTSKKPANMEFLRVPYLAEYLVILSRDGKQLRSIPLMEALRDSPYASSQQLLIRQNSGPEADYTHANSVMVLPRALAPRFPMFKEGHVLVSLRNMSTLAVLDLSTSKASAVWAAQGVWRSQHAAEFLDNGHLLLFDNEGGNGASRVLEYNAANQALTWTYTSEDSPPFWTSVRGATQRLPNGNTLIVNPAKGKLFEVTAAKEVVWEAVCQECAGKAAVGPSINWARRYRADSLTFLKGGPRDKH